MYSEPDLHGALRALVLSGQALVAKLVELHFSVIHATSSRRLGEGCRSAHSSIAHYDVPPLGINLHQGWGVRSVIEIGVVL